MMTENCPLVQVRSVFFTHADFVQEILAHPDDDAPRLIFADYLEEHGDPRGEFIRVQCEIASLTKPSQQPSRMYGADERYTHPEKCVRSRGRLDEFKRLLRRQLELLSQHVNAWVAPLDGKATGVLFERGFIDGFTTTGATFVKHVEQWLRHVPLRRIRIQKFDRAWDRFLASPYLAYLHVLDLDYYTLSLPRLEQLVKCQHLSGLRRLDFGGFVNESDQVVRLILDSPFLKNLRAVPDLYQGIQDADLRKEWRRRFPDRR